MRLSLEGAFSKIRLSHSPHKQRLSRAPQKLPRTAGGPTPRNAHTRQHTPPGPDEGTEKPLMSRLMDGS